VAAGAGGVAGAGTPARSASILTQPGRYAGLADPRVLRVLALSGGYSRDKACALLVRDLTSAQF
jgi:fructose-bisphosphate aldolase class 1